MPLKCCCSCTVFEDDYSTDRLTTDYDTRSGTWSVTSGQLQTSSSSALLIVDSDLPASHRIECTVDSTSDGDLIRQIVAYVDDDNYLFSQVKRWSSIPNQGTLSLWKRESGSETQLAIQSFLSIASATMSTCWEPSTGQLSCRASSNYQLVVSGLSSSGVRAGLGTSTVSGTVSFDDLVIDKVLGIRCPNCACHVCEQTPSQVSIDFSGVGSGTCANWNTLNTNTFVLNRQYGGIGGSEDFRCYYQATLPAGNCGLLVTYQILAISPPTISGLLSVSSLAGGVPVDTVTGQVSIGSTSQVDCLSSQSITSFSGSMPNADFSSATATVTPSA